MILRRTVNSICPHHALLAALVICQPDLAAAHAPGSVFFAEGVAAGWALCAAYFMFAFAKDALDYLLCGLLVLLAVALLARVVVETRTAHPTPIDLPQAEPMPGGAE